MDKPHIIKSNGRKQRENIALSLEVANAITDLILAGQKIYSKSGLEVIIKDEQGPEKTINIGAGTINSWITRGNIIPETGETLRDVINRAREQYRIDRKQESHLNMVSWAEKEIRRTMLLRTNIPVRNHLGQVLKHEDGSYVRKENPALLRVKVETAKFILEKLEPETYGKKDHKQNQQQKWSLAELRRYSNSLLGKT